jgi:hypothetical protein
LHGKQRPRILSLPASTSSLGAEAVELAAAFGLVLDPWQAFVLEHSLALRDYKWAAFEVGVCVPRQNGKGSIVEARELAGLFLMRERLQIYSAHQFDTSLEAFRRLLFLIENNADAESRVKRVSRSHGEEGIELKGGYRIRFRTRTKGGGRGFTGDTLYLDEAMILPVAAHGALLPTLSARPNPQVWYLGSAVDQKIHEDGLVFARVRDRGLRGGDAGLAYFEWSVDAGNPDDVPKHVRDGEEAVAQANPALGIRISLEHVTNERASMDPRTFNVERLGVGDWPSLEEAGSVIPVDVWLELIDHTSAAVDPVCFAYDVQPSRESASIGVAGFRPDGQLHVEVVEQRAGTGWVAPRLAELVAAHGTVREGVVYDGSGPGASLAPEIAEAGVKLHDATAREHAQACGMLFDRVERGTLRHLGTPELVNALRVAVKRPLGDAWAWDRRTTAVDISPLVAVTLAAWGASTGKRKGAPRLL